MAISLTALKADTAAILSDWAQTVTIARLKTLTTMMDSYGQVTPTSSNWSKVTTTIADLQSPGQFQRTSQGALAQVQVGGVVLEVRKIGYFKKDLAPRNNDRVYEGSAITSTAASWHVGLVDTFEDLDRAVLVDKGPKLP